MKGYIFSYIYDIYIYRFVHEYIYVINIYLYLFIIFYARDTNNELSLYKLSL